jgi:hypothetical protein
MVRHLTTLILGGILGSMVLVGNAQACHKTKCRHKAPVACAPTPAPCVQPVAYCKPAPTCAPKVKHCKLTLPKFCHKKTCAPAPVVLACATPVYVAPAAYPVAYPVGSPQVSGQR